MVVDEGISYRGTDEVRRSLSEAGARFTCTATLVGAQRAGDARWIAVQHLEGDFPGGVVDLRYRFVVDGDAIAELVIAP